MLRWRSNRRKNHADYLFADFQDFLTPLKQYLPDFICCRKEMAQPDSAGPQAFRRGGWETAGDPHARAPQLQVQTSQTEA